MMPKTLTSKPEMLFMPYALALMVLISGFIMTKPDSAQAEGITIGFSPVWWQYQESSEQRIGYPKTPFASSVSGLGMELDMEGDIQIGNGLHFLSSWSYLLPVSQSTETWTQLAGIQTNNFQATETEFRTSLMRDFEGWEMGVWVSYMLHIQERQNFFLNGVRSIVVGEPIREYVQVSWIGLNFRTDLGEGIEISWDAAMPISVRTTNDLVADTFTRRSGYRMGANASWSLGEQADSDYWSASLGYKYRQLGNDLGRTALWPKNTWQALSLNLSYTW